MVSLALRYVALTDVGLRRSNNQDSAYASDRLLILADGMGGAAAGDLASAEALSVLRRLDRDLDVDPLFALERAIDYANERLGELVTADPAVEGMGTTIEVMLWDGKRFATAHLGDSRAYRLRDGVLTQISHDHTFVQSLVDEGKLSAADARVHPHRSLLLRVMLGRDDNEADLGYIEPQLGDRYLLCSDGLSDMVEDHVIAEALAAETIDMAATELVRLALEAGGHDNITIVIGEMDEKSAPVDEHLSCADGRPQLVGAAAAQPRPRTGQAATVKTPDPDIDPEELRYAPQQPKRWRRIRWAIVALLLLGGLVAAGFVGYDWSQKQYFVAAQDGKVAIFRGVQADLPGITLQHVDEVTDLTLDSLPAYARRQVTDGITASSRDDAVDIIESLSETAIPPTPEPTPAPTRPSPTEPSPKPTRTATATSAIAASWFA